MRMNDDQGFRRAAAWLAILAWPLAYANVGLGLVSVDFDLTVFADTVSGFQQVANHPSGAELVRWSMVSDMLGFYLLLIPLTLVLWNWLREHQPQLVNLSTLFGLGYLFFGAMGAAILSMVLPAQIVAYAQAVGADRQVHQALSLAFTNAIYDGLWGTLNPVLAGVWWVGIGQVLRRERRVLGWTTIALGGFMLLRDVKIFSIDSLGLGVYFALAPIWAAWLGLDLLRSNDPAGRPRSAL